MPFREHVAFAGVFLGPCWTWRGVTNKKALRPDRSRVAGSAFTGVVHSADEHELQQRLG